MSRRYRVSAYIFVDADHAEDAILVAREALQGLHHHIDMIGANETIEVWDTATATSIGPPHNKNLTDG